MYFSVNYNVSGHGTNYEFAVCITCIECIHNVGGQIDGIQKCTVPFSQNVPPANTPVRHTSTQLIAQRLRPGAWLCGSRFSSHRNRLRFERGLPDAASMHQSAVRQSVQAHRPVQGRSGVPGGQPQSRLRQGYALLKNVVCLQFASLIMNLMKRSNRIVCQCQNNANCPDPFTCDGCQCITSKFFWLSFTA